MHEFIWTASEPVLHIVKTVAFSWRSLHYLWSKLPSSCISSFEQLTSKEDELSTFYNQFRNLRKPQTRMKLWPVLLYSFGCKLQNKLSLEYVLIYFSYVWTLLFLLGLLSCALSRTLLCGTSYLCTLVLCVCVCARARW